MISLPPAAWAARPGLQAAAVRVNSRPTRCATMAGLAQAAHGLDPAEALLDPLAERWLAA